MDYLIGWISTIVATSIIKKFMVFNILKDAADQGYKINIQKMSENVDNFQVSEETGASSIVDYVPIINMMNSFNSFTQYIYNRDSVLIALDQLDVIEEMNDAEKNVYNKKSNLLSLLKIYRNNIKRIEEENQEKELKYSLEKIHHMHIIEEYMEYFGSMEKSIEEYEKDKTIRLHNDDKDLEDKLKKYRFVEVGDQGKIYYSIDDNKGIYSLDDFRIVYIDGLYRNDDVSFNERKVGYFLSIMESERDNEIDTDKVNIINRK